MQGAVCLPRAEADASSIDSKEIELNETVGLLHENGSISPPTSDHYSDALTSIDVALDESTTAIEGREPSTPR